MLKLFSWVFVLGILVLVLGVVKSTNTPTRDNKDRVRVKRIIDGQFVDRNRNTVFRISSGFDDCTGTFIAPNMILTTARCFSGLALSVSKPFTISNGERTIEVTISALHINPIFAAKWSPEEDIGVIQLDRNVDSIRVASLGFDYTLSCNETVYQYGYGHTKVQYHKSEPSTLVRVKQLKVCPGKVVDCSWFTYYKHYIPFMHFNDALATYCSEICAFMGDWGGPVFNEHNSIVGVHSDITTNRFDNQFGSSARISKHTKFLQEILSQN